MDAPILTIDGPSGSGKGTISGRLACHLGWHVLYSGLIYRGLAIAISKQNIASDDEAAIAALALTLKINFTTQVNDSILVFVAGEDVTSIITLEKTGTLASIISGYGAVREALLERQRRFCCLPGLVAEGRDMGTVVFPHAPYKVFLTASAEIRAERRYKQLKEQGKSANLTAILAETKARDARDEGRSIAPLAPAKEALYIDSSHHTADDVVKQILNHFSL
ncbi:MAG: (d)CMP kinase [Gammaproteobacteria bacterium]